MAKHRQRIETPPPRKISVVDAVSEAWSEIESLAEEMQTWRDNMEEKLSHTDKYGRVSECAETLESGSEPSEPASEAVKAVMVTIQDPKPKRRGYSRADRLSQACSILSACEDALDEFIDTSTVDSDKEDADNYKQEVVELKDNVESAEFPGMFG